MSLVQATCPWCGLQSLVMLPQNLERNPPVTDPAGEDGVGPASWLVSPPRCLGLGWEDLSDSGAQQLKLLCPSSWPCARRAAPTQQTSQAVPGLPSVFPPTRAKPPAFRTQSQESCGFTATGLYVVLPVLRRGTHTPPLGGKNSKEFADMV